MTPARRAPTIALAAGVGFAAGAFLMAFVVWQFGNVVGGRADRARYPARAPSALARRSPQTLDDAGSPVLETGPGQAADESGRLRPGPAGTSGGAVPELQARPLRVPVQGVERQALRSTFDELRGTTRRHEAIDILAPRHTPVVAVEAGTIARLFYSKAGGLTIYQYDPTGEYVYYYAHLERYADGLKEGDPVTTGQVIGYVGTSGNAPSDTPHLHFAIIKLEQQKRWWEGTAIDPFPLLREAH